MSDWVAIVDDDVANLTVASRILYRENMKVSTLKSGKELLVFLNHNRPDLVLLDIYMPGQDGFQTLEAIRAREELDDLPVIFLTGDEDADTEERGLEAGAEDFIKKPFEPAILTLRVRRTIELARLRSHLVTEVEKKTHEVMEQYEQIKTLSVAAETDQMTGLLNKTSAQDAIGEQVKHTQGILMMIDLDSFKLVNDIYGHGAGDKILIRFASIIRSAIRTTDIAGRMGGDEFIAYCEHISEESVINEKARYMNEELKLYAKKLLGDDMNIPLGVSIGAVMCPDEGKDFLTLFKKADEALYDVKQNGKHGCAFYWESRRPTTGTVASGSSHAKAILNEREQESKEALLLPFEQFRTVYRLFVRLNRNYTIRTAFILFTIQPKDETSDVGRATDGFCDSLKTALRSSDVLTKNGINQCMVLLLHTDIQYGETIAQRIIRKWHQDKSSFQYEVDYDIELI